MTTATKAEQDGVLQTIGRIHEDVLLKKVAPGYVQHTVVDFRLPNGETLPACALCSRLREAVKGMERYSASTRL